MIDTTVDEISDSASLTDEELDTLPSKFSTIRRPLLHFKGGTARTSVLALACSAIGTSLLTMPYAMKCTGIILGLLLLFLAAIIGYIGVYILIKAVRHYRCDSYSSLVTLLLSRSMGFSIDLFIAFNGIVAGALFFIFLADFISSLITLIDADLLKSIDARFVRMLIILISSILTFPLSMQQNYRTLKRFTLIFVGGILLTTAVVAIRTPFYFQKISRINNKNIDWFNFNKNTIRSFNIFMYGYMQHQNVVPICQDMTEGTLTRSTQVTLGALGIQTLVYIILTLSGYLSFQRITQQNFINNYPEYDNTIIFSRIILSLCLLFCIPMGLISTASSLRKIYRLTKNKVMYYCGRRQIDHTSITNPTLTEGLIQPIRPKHISTLKERLISITVAYSIEIFIALITHQAAVIVSVLGGIISIYLMAVIPFLVFLKSAYIRNTTSLPKTKMTILFLASAVVIFSSIGVIILL